MNLKTAYNIYFSLLNIISEINSSEDSHQVYYCAKPLYDIIMRSTLKNKAEFILDEDRVDGNFSHTKKSEIINNVNNFFDS